jgi:hypothetical protein
LASSLALLTDVVGINDDSIVCHPYLGLTRSKRGYYSFTLSNDNKTFAPISEADLRRKIESGEFNDRGRIRMVPFGSTAVSGAGAMRVVRYNGRLLPL